MRWLLFLLETCFQEEFDKEFEKNYYEPCQQVEKVLYSYDEYESPVSNTSIREDKLFQLILNFQGDTYMEIEQIPAYDIQSLFGNAGGYIGVFLGVSFLQLPFFLVNTYTVIRNSFH